MKKFGILFVSLLGGLPVCAAFAQGVPAAPAAVNTSMDQGVVQMTLWQTLAAGGPTMLVIGFLSLAAGAIIIYDFMNLSVDKLAPRTFTKKILAYLDAKNVEEARVLCVKENNNIVARIALAGIDKLRKSAKGGAPVGSAKDAVEHVARIEIGALWQNINYLSDIVAIAPLLGLLGTVAGMIQAFRAVPLQSAALKTTLLAAGISKAMITTGSGLIVAIAALMAYSFFRGKVQELTNVIEMNTTDLMKVMENL